MHRGGRVANVVNSSGAAKLCNTSGFVYMDNGLVKSLNQVWANVDELEALRKAMRKNIRRRAQNRGYTKKQNNNLVNEDWMMNGPVHSKDVPRGEIWIYETREEGAERLKEKFERDRKERNE